MFSDSLRGRAPGGPGVGRRRGRHPHRTPDSEERLFSTHHTGVRVFAAACRRDAGVLCVSVVFTGLKTAV